MRVRHPLLFLFVRCLLLPDLSFSSSSSCVPPFVLFLLILTHIIVLSPSTVPSTIRIQPQRHVRTHVLLRTTYYYYVLRAAAHGPATYYWPRLMDPSPLRTTSASSSLPSSSSASSSSSSSSPTSSSSSSSSASSSSSPSSSSWDAAVAMAL